jgi:quercetin dioxygenase-like cupin family protein
MSYTHLPKDDPSIESFRGAFLKVRRALGTTVVGVNEIRLPPGASGREHDERDTGHEEIYFVVEGTGTFTVDGDAIAVGPGDYLRVDPEAVRVASAGDDGLRFLALGGQPHSTYDGRESL